MIKCDICLPADVLCCNLQLPLLQTDDDALGDLLSCEPRPLVGDGVEHPEIHSGISLVPRQSRSDSRAIGN